MNLKPILPNRKTGNEAFHTSGKTSTATLMEFWQWAYSDLLGNTPRGVIAEYLVALDLGVANGTREEWAPFDLKTKEGIRVEVKASAYIQSWFQKRHSTITFSIRPAMAWDPETNSFGGAKIRHSDYYVFCLLHHKDQASIDPMDTDQWTFYVMPTVRLDEELGDQKTIGLGSLLKMRPVKCAFGEISNAIKSLQNH